MPFGFRGGGGKSGWGRRRGFRNFMPSGPPTNCICSKCGMIIPHRSVTPCFRIKCPRCGAPMTRQFSHEG